MHSILRKDYELLNSHRSRNCLLRSAGPVMPCHDIDQCRPAVGCRIASSLSTHLIHNGVTLPRTQDCCVSSHSLLLLAWTEPSAPQGSNPDHHTIMDRQKFETMFPSLVAHYPTVRSKSYYKVPGRRSGPGTAPILLEGGADLTASIGSKEDFWVALDVLLDKSLGPGDALPVRQAFVDVYKKHLSRLNIEQIEELANSV